jgi:hypothetical protein
MNINNTELENIRHNVDEQTADEIGLSASSCCRPVSSAIDVPFLISQVLRECEKGDLADFSILSCLDSEPDSKVLVEKLIASRLSFLKNQKGIQSVQDGLMSFVEKLQETLSSDPSIIGVNFRDNVERMEGCKPFHDAPCSIPILSWVFALQLCLSVYVTVSQPSILVVVWLGSCIGVFWSWLWILGVCEVNDIFGLKSIIKSKVFANLYKKSRRKSWGIR